MAKNKGFVSLDFDIDKILKEFLIGQAKLTDSPFEVSDHSLKEETLETEWLTEATAAMKRAEVFIVMLGMKTRSASGVLKEVAVAKGLTRCGFNSSDTRTGPTPGPSPTAGARMIGIGKF